MLKPYKVHTYISVNGGSKTKVWSVGYGLTEDELPNTVELSYTFQEALTKELPTPDVTTGTTLFRKRPYVKIQYSWCCEDEYYNFITEYPESKHRNAVERIGKEMKKLLEN